MREPQAVRVGQNDLDYWVGAELLMVEFLGGMRGADVARVCKGSV